MSVSLGNYEIGFFGAEYGVKVYKIPTKWLELDSTENKARFETEDLMLDKDFSNASAQMESIRNKAQQRIVESEPKEEFELLIPDNHEEDGATMESEGPAANAVMVPRNKITREMMPNPQLNHEEYGSIYLEFKILLVALMWLAIRLLKL